MRDGRSQETIGQVVSRSEKAAATRRRILDAAQRLFAEYGYAGTTMQAIADEADVAVQTVYFVFHTKAELLRQLLKSVGGRPEDSLETMERDWVHEAMTDSDGRRSVALMIEHGNDIYARIAPVWAAIGQAGSVEPEYACTAGVVPNWTCWAISNRGWWSRC